MPIPISSLPFGLLAFARQTLQMDRSVGCMERGTSLHVFVETKNGPTELQGPEKGRVIRDLFRAVIRKSADATESLLTELRDAEQDLTMQLRHPSEEEMGAQIRHTVTPLLAAIITE